MVAPTVNSKLLPAPTRSFTHGVAAASGTTEYPPTAAFLCSAAGTATVVMNGDGLPVALGTLIAGTVYPFSITGFTAGTATLVLLW